MTSRIMGYRSLSRALARAYDQEPDIVPLASGLVSHNRWFTSEARHILPGRSSYQCALHGESFEAPALRGTGAHEKERLHEVDGDVGENNRFRFSVFAGEGAAPAEGVIFLFHGLNERDWSKYLPWAVRLAETTGKAVILFPLAFHMNRAPAEWSRPQLMRGISDERSVDSPTIVNSTFANAAISARLQAYPGRFCWSGLQTFYDVVQLVDEIRDGRHEVIARNASVDFFAYSIGAFLSEILLMADPEGRFSSSRLFTFCGGATLDRTYPNSRYILDSDATIALYSFFLARFENELRVDDRLAHYMSDIHAEGRYFRAMLNYHDKKDIREQRLVELSDRIAALALRRDTVIPANEVLNTLKGDFREIPIRVDVTDFPYEHSHVIPFPLNAPEAQVNAAFDRVFERAAEHLS